MAVVLGNVELHVTLLTCLHILNGLMYMELNFLQQLTQVMHSEPNSVTGYVLGVLYSFCVSVCLDIGQLIPVSVGLFPILA